MKRQVVLAVTLSFCVLSAVPAAAPGSGLEGRWRLVEQGHGSGRFGDAVLEDPLRLECLTQGGSLGCRVWTAEKKPRALDWPAFVSENGPRPVRVVERVLDERTGHLLARYTVDLPPPGHRRLEIVEDYRLTKPGELAGTVRVRLLKAGESQGSWLLHRRFEREP